MRRLWPVSSLLVLATGLAAAASPAEEARRICRFQDNRIAESSGLASSSFSDTALWTHNDSGDTGRFFLVDSPSCTTVASYAIAVPPSVQEPSSGESTNNLDIEDMARTALPDGSPSLLLADIGDNQQARGVHVVFELREPSGAATDPQAEVSVTPVAYHVLAYPSQPWDAEAVVALPDRRLLVVTKPRSLPPDLAYTGHSEVYVSATPMAPSGIDPLVMTKVADVDLTALTGSGSGDAIAVTAADVSADGTLLALRTYTTAYVWRLHGSDLAAAFAPSPYAVPLLATKQGEGLAWTRRGHDLWTSSEGSGTDGDPTSGVVDRYGVGLGHLKA